LPIRQLTSCALAHFADLISGICAQISRVIFIR
jgi:hypothetical protein